MKIKFHYSMSYPNNGGEININTRTSYLYFKKEPFGLNLSEIPKEMKEEFYFKKVDSNWQSTKKAKEINNKIEYFLPNSTYLSCSNKELNVCKYKTLITYNTTTQKANVREIIIADCFIGTMGCNKYEKGLELNIRRCQIKNDPSVPN